MSQRNLKKFIKNTDLQFHQLRKRYLNQARTSCIELDKNFHHIVVIRHGEPILEKRKFYNRAQAKQYYIDYDAAKVKDDIQFSLCTDNLFVNRIYHSNLPRAEHTAKLLFPNHFKFIADSRFREFERAIFPFFNIPLPLSVWKIFSRIFWIMGCTDKTIESFRLARQRVKENANYLTQKAKADKDIIVVAHGWHNKFLLKYLKRRGWKHIYGEGIKYLGVNIMVTNK